MATERQEAPVPDYIPALTVRQPWASAIILGGKTPENRPRRMAYLGPLLIHAGMRVDWDAPDFAWHAAGLTPPPRGQRFDRGAWTASLSLGTVLGQVTVTGCHRDEIPGHPSCPAPLCTRWAVRDQWHIELEGPLPLPSPVPCKGALGLWRLPPEAEAAVRTQLPANSQPAWDLELGEIHA
jgi:hypothetical protein